MSHLVGFQTILAGGESSVGAHASEAVRSVNTRQETRCARSVSIVLGAEEAAQVFLFKLHALNVHPNPAHGQGPRDYARHGEGKSDSANDKPRIPRMSHETIRAMAHHLAIAQTTSTLLRKVDVCPNQPHRPGNAHRQSGNLQIRLSQ